jgi:copper(I)-binding protein
MPVRDDHLRMKRIVACTSLAALALAACGSDDSGISIEGAWARSSPASTTLGAAYFEITADEADTLVAVSVPSSLAGRAEIHEVVPADMADEMEDGRRERT